MPGTLLSMHESIAGDRMRTTLLIFLSLLALHAHAGTYRWVDADGRVNYGDRPPPGRAWLVRDDAGNSDPVQPPAAGALPYAVSSAAKRYPVRLYTTRDCPACDAARTQLIQRGIPFVERTLRSEADAAAFKRLGFADLRVPALSVGSQTAQGYAAGDWNQLLDAAGYPKSSMLPRGWRPAAAQPLVPGGGDAPASGRQDTASAGDAQPKASGQPQSSERAQASEQGQASEQAQASQTTQADSEPPPGGLYAAPEGVRRSRAAATSGSAQGSRVRF